MQPMHRGEAPLSRARRWLVGAAIVLAVLGVSACGMLALLGLRCVREVERQLVGELDTDAPSWSPADVASDTRVILGASLPATARNVHYRHSAGGPDVIGALRADVTEPEFHALMSSTGLTPWSPTRTFTDDVTWLSFSTYPGPTPAPWWTPPTTIDENVYVRQDGSVWRMARWDGRTLWYSIVSH